MVENVVVPASLLKELHEHLVKVQEVLATLEEFMGKEGIARIRRASEEYRKGEYVGVLS